MYMYKINRLVAIMVDNKYMYMFFNRHSFEHPLYPIFIFMQQNNTHFRAYIMIINWTIPSLSLSLSLSLLDYQMI